MKSFKNMGGLFPTVFDLPEVWEINSKRCGGRFNLYFFWAYPIVAFLQIPFTVLCSIELALTND